MRGLPRVVPSCLSGIMECGNERVPHVVNSVLNKVNAIKSNFKINIRDVPEHDIPDHFNN